MDPLQWDSSLSVVMVFPFNYENTFPLMAVCTLRIQVLQGVHVYLQDMQCVAIKDNPSGNIAFNEIMWQIIPV